MKWRDPTPKPPMNSDNPWQLFQVSQFAGGLVTSTTANQLGENQFTQFENLLYNPDGTLRTRCGKKTYGTVADADWIAKGATGTTTYTNGGGNGITLFNGPHALFNITGDFANGSGPEVIAPGDIVTGAGASGTADDTWWNKDHVVSSVVWSAGLGITQISVEDTGSASDGTDLTDLTLTTYQEAENVVSFFVGDVEGAEKLLISKDDGSEVVVAVEDGDFTTELNSLTASYRPSFVKYSQGSAEEVIIANGKDTPQRWNKDDSTTSDLGLAAGMKITDVTAATPGVFTVEGDWSNVVADDTFTVINSTVTDYNGTYIVASVSGTGPTTITVDESTSGFDPFTGTALGQQIPTFAKAGAGVVGSGPTANGTYSYKFTYFYNESGTTKYGESNGTEAISHANTAITFADATDGEPITISDLSLPAECEAINIYRSRPDRTDVFYYVGRMTTDKESFVDTTATGAEGLPLAVDDGSVPKLLYPKNIDGRIVAVDGDIQNKLVWSDRGSPDQYPALNYVYVRDKIKGLAAFNGSTYFFTQQEVFVIPNSDFASGIAVKICDKGAMSDRAIVDVGSGLVWLGEDNIYWANFNTQTSDGDFPIAVGRPIENLIRQQSQSGKENACATFFERHFYISFTSVGSSENNVTLAMNTDIMQQALRMEGAGWSRMNWFARDISNHEEKLYTLELYDDTTFYIYEHEDDRYVDYDTYTKYTTPTETGIDINLRSGELHFGSPVTNKLIKGMSVSYYGDNATYTIVLDANNTEYTKSMVLTNTGLTPAGAGSWLYWNAAAAAAGAWYGYPTATVAPDAWYTVTGVTQADPAVVTITEDVSGLSSLDEVWVSGVTEDYQYNKKWTVASTSGAGPTNVTMTESSAGFDAAGTSGTAFAQWGTKTDANNQYQWASSQQGNNTLRKKITTMKCSRFIYELTGTAHGDAKLGSIGIIFKVLPTAF